MPDELHFSLIKENIQESIQCRLLFCKLPSFPSENCLIATFSGTVVETDSHNSGYKFMHAMIGDGFAASNPATLLLDLRDLEYVSGNQMSRIVDQRIITKVVSSQICFEGLNNLYRSALFLNPSDEIFESVEEALNACDSAYRQFLRDGRKKTIAADF